MRSSITPRHLGLLALGLAAAAACGSLDTQDRVHDLRILGMRADPPEQLYGLPAFHNRDAGAPNLDAGLFDGGLDLCLLLEEFDAGSLLPPGFDAGCSEVVALAPYTVTALVADPEGNGRVLHVAWTACVTVDDDARCGTTALGYQALSQGDFTPTGISSELSTTFLPSAVILAAAKGTGLTSISLPIQVTITTGSETVVGIKTVVVTPYNRALPTTANTNPLFSGLLAGGIAWSTANPPIFTSVSAGSGSTSGGGLGGRGGAGGAGTANGVAVDAELDAGAETYTAYLTDGTPTTRQERLAFDFFTTMGDFNPVTAGHSGTVLIPDAGGVDAGPPDAGPDAGPPNESHWTADPNAPSQTVTFWVVVRDGRGGEDWVERTAQFTP